MSEQVKNNRGMPAKKSSEIGGEPVLLPIAVAGRLEAAAAAGFLGPLGGFVGFGAIALGAPRGGFGERAFGGRRQRALFWLVRVGWHRP